MANLHFNKLRKTDAIWLPQLPEHWELVKVRHLFNNTSDSLRGDSPIVTEGCKVWPGFYGSKVQP
jgi:hypothetical protein